MTYCIINCTTATKEQAVEISKHLVDKKLIACCNIIPAVTSVYEWNDKLCSDEECLMIMKTKTQLFKQIETEIKQLHSYEIPEIICIPVSEGSYEYLNWIDKKIITK